MSLKYVNINRMSEERNQVTGHLKHETCDFSMHQVINSRFRLYLLGVIMNP